MESLGPCELCGHPVFEWQKHERRLHEIWGSDDEPWYMTHLNPADHQPTVLPALDTPAKKT